MKILLKILVLTFALLILMKTCTPFLGVDNPLVGGKAPDFTLETLSGQKINMTEFRKGQPAIIFFWATWCPHCRTQLLELTQHRQQIEASGIKIILVDAGENIKTVRDYIESNSISFDVFLDESTDLANEYQIIGVPTFFFVNGEGIIIEVKNSLPGNYQDILLSPAL